MKNRNLFLAVMLAVWGLTGCNPEDGENPFLLDLPALPESWTDLLGSPRWLIRYYAGNGRETVAELDGERAEIFLSPSRVSPIFAWPYWPDRHLKPEDFRPAGAIIPYDISAPDRISLSWQGGVDAWFFEALNGGKTAETAPAGIRQGRNFDWPGFRALFTNSALSPELCSDPWLAGWEAIAEKTLRSGFRSQWISPAKTVPLNIPAPEGLWISPSPFARPLAAEGETTAFMVREGPGIQAWYSAAGVLHCAGTSWILLPWE
ncbi:MAG: hypothetical protein LBI94_02925 [Treponema sp.]|jgi:hypothetical protein|nr:hypothetical protein [Treponema sp.]